MYKYKVVDINVKQCIIFCAIFCLFLRSLHPVFAQTLPKQNLEITPIIQDLQLTAGHTYTYPLEIKNLADKPMGIHVDVNGFDPTNTFNTATITSSLIAWTKLSQQDIIIPALGEKQIPVTITVPKIAEEKGYYETFTITPFLSQQQNAKSPVVLTRFIALVFVTVGNINYSDLEKKVTITHFAPTSFVFGNISALLNFDVQNLYFTHFLAKPFITIKPFFGKEQTFALDEKHIFPATSKDWQAQIPVNTHHIFYTATLALSVGQGYQLFATTHFVYLPSGVIIAFIISFLLIALTLLRKRLFMFIKIMLKG